MQARLKRWLGGRLSRQLMAALAISVFLVGAPAGLLLYYFSERWAVDDAKRIILSIQENKLREIEIALAQADPSLTKLNGFITNEMQAAPDAGDLAAFDKLVIPFEDGSLRSNPKTFDGRQHAGIYIDPTTPRTDDVKAFHARLAPIIDLYGAGTVPRFDTLWLLTRWHSMIVLMPRVPTYVWDATPADDYNTTEWIMGADPAVNPTRALYWTKPAYDHVSRSWMVSAVRPLDVNGAWVGTIGHDFFLAGLFDRLASDPTFAGAEDFLVDAKGDYMMAGRWQSHIESVAFTAGDKAVIDKALAPVFQSLRTTSGPMVTTAQFLGEPYLATVSTVAGPDWKLIHLVPIKSVAGRISQAFAGSILVTLIAFLLVAGAIHGLLQRRVIHPLRALAESVQRFESGENDSRALVRGHDEIGRLAAAFNSMAERIGKSHKKLEKARHELERRNVELQHATRAKSNFLANMSHELRTPLNAILGFSEILDLKLFGPLGDHRYGEYVININKSGKHLLELIDDILDISRIEADKVTLNFEDCDIRPLIDSCLTMVRPAADEGGLTLQGPTGMGQIVLNCDKRAFKQMLLNLLSNAVRHTPADGRVAVTIDPAPNGDLVVSVRDNGGGIPDKVLPHLFSPFGVRSAHIAHSGNGGRSGTGLGLSITRSLIRRHNGDITVHTKADIGTTMSLVFPADRVRAVSADRKVPAEAQIAG